jgi:hypothetical protein
MILVTWFLYSSIIISLIFLDIFFQPIVLSYINLGLGLVDKMQRINQSRVSSCFFPSPLLFTLFSLLHFLILHFLINLVSL